MRHLIYLLSVIALGCGDTSHTDSLYLTRQHADAKDIGARLNHEHFMIGGDVARDEDFGAAPFDIRYVYLAGDVPRGGPCVSCANDCNTSWWGCWQWDQLPPGDYVRQFIDKVVAAQAVPMFTYYVWPSVSGGLEGSAEIAALADADHIFDYFSDWRFLMQQIAGSTTEPVIVHVEPDLWGYSQHEGAANAVVAAVDAAAAPECESEPNTMAGFTHCLLAIARAEAPNVLVGLHASSWATGADAYLNNDSSYDVGADARATAAYLLDLGADYGDLIVVEMSDRDAGYNNRWWDATDASLPSFAQALTWTKTLSESLGLAQLWWQVPFGHMGLSNTCDAYEDNRLDYVFDHPERFVAAGGLGVTFGAGASCMTTPASDGGHFITRAQAYYESGAPPL